MKTPPCHAQYVLGTQLEFELPHSRQWNWKRIINTTARSPEDIFPETDAPAIKRGKVKVEARSVVVTLD